MRDLSPAFAGRPFHERPVGLYRHWDWSSGVALEVLCYTPEEVERKAADPGLVRRALEEGLVFS